MWIPHRGVRPKSVHQDEKISEGPTPEGKNQKKLSPGIKHQQKEEKERKKSNTTPWLSDQGGKSEPSTRTEEEEKKRRNNPGAAPRQKPGEAIPGKEEKQKGSETHYPNKTKPGQPDLKESTRGTNPPRKALKNKKGEAK